MPPILKRLLGLTVTIFVLTGGIYFFADNPEHLEALHNLTVGNLAALLFLMAVFFVVTGLTFNALLVPFSIRLSLLETAGLSFLSNLISYLLPFRIGTGVKAVYLNRTRQLSYTHFTVVTGANALVLLWVAGVLGLATLLVRLAKGHDLPWPLFLISLAACCTILAIPTARYAHDQLHRSTSSRFLMSFLESAKELSLHPGSMLQCCIWVVGQFALVAALNQLAFQALGIPLELSAALTLGVFTTMANFFTLTPGNIGVQEAIMGALASHLGIPFGDGLLAAALLRALHIAVCLFASPLVIHPLLHNSHTRIGELLSGKEDVQHQTTTE